MRTEIKKGYKWGFHLTEQELRRIVQAVVEHAEKASAGLAHKLTLRATLKDGAIIQTTILDEILLIENAGGKQVRRIEISEAPALNDQSWKVAVTYQDASANAKSWVAVDYEIAGESRDWAFVTASDIEERLKRTKVVAWDAIFGNKWAPTIALMIGLILSTALLPYVLMDRTTHIRLQQQYDTGVIHDPIQAMIWLEKTRNEQSGKSMAGLMLLSFGAPLAVFLVGLKLLPLIKPSYTFYWGDFTAIYDRRKQMRSVIWTVIILGLVVSIIAGIITKKLGY